MKNALSRALSFLFVGATVLLLSPVHSQTPAPKKVVCQYDDEQLAQKKDWLRRSMNSTLEGTGQLGKLPAIYAQSLSSAAAKYADAKDKQTRAHGPAGHECDWSNNGTEWKMLLMSIMWFDMSTGREGIRNKPEPGTSFTAWLLHGIESGLVMPIYNNDEAALRQLNLDFSSAAIAKSYGGEAGNALALVVGSQYFLSAADIRAHEEELKHCGSNNCDVSKNYDRRDAFELTRQPISPTTVLTVQALKEERERVIAASSAPGASPMAKHYGLLSVKQLDRMIGVVQKSTFMKQAADAGLTVLDIGILKEWAIEKTLDAAAVQKLMKARGKDVSAADAEVIAKRVYADPVTK